jgi:hypothetical protein
MQHRLAAQQTAARFWLRAGSELSARFVNDVLPTTALAICRKIPVRTGAPTRSPCCSDGSTTAPPGAACPGKLFKRQAFDSAATWRYQPQPDRRK